MKVEYLENGSQDYPLIRIYGTRQTEFLSLLQAVRDVAAVIGKRSAIHEISGFDAVSNCMLTIVSSSVDEGIRQISATNFSWTLTQEKWRLVSGLIEPFASQICDGSYQWLSGKEARYGLNRGAISVLLSCSPDGHW